MSVSNPDIVPLDDVQKLRDALMVACRLIYNDPVKARHIAQDLYRDGSLLLWLSDGCDIARSGSVVALDAHRKSD